MMKRGPLLLSALALVCLVGDARAWVQSAAGVVWAAGPVSLQVRTGSTPMLTDRGNWETNALAAMDAWNRNIHDVQLVGTNAGAGAAGENNGRSEIAFASDMFGEDFGSHTLAVTCRWYLPSTKRYTEADILVNSGKNWDAYRGPLRYPPGGGYARPEFRRVLMHELGHVLGLSHPDTAGQTVSALMNSTMSDLEAPTADDQEGVGTLYGRGVDNVPQPPVATQLINLSARAQVGAGSEVLIPGFVVGGTRIKRLLIRAVGPALEPFGVSDCLQDPTLELKTLAGALVATNDDWNAGDAIAMTQAGAFALPASSKDASLIVTLEPGMYTAVVADKNGRAGVALVELYDLSPAGGKLVNISTRARVGTGNNALIPGLVVSGNAPKRLLVRAAGPALQAFGVDGCLADPQMQVTKLDGTPVVANDNWDGSDTALKAAFTATGAFAFTTGSKDAALLVDLAPGQYTVVVRGVNDTTGVALVEVYEVP